MIIYIFFVFNTFLFTWYSSKLLKDVSGRDQYWHIPQVIMLISFFLMPVVVASFKIDYLIRVCLFGMMFPFLFNTGLNLYRGLPVNHLGKYDFLKYWQTVLLFIIGFLSIMGYDIWIKNYIQ